MTHTEAPPDHLGLPGKRFWQEVVQENDGLGPEDFALLTIACESLDTISTARKRLAKDGLFITPPPHHEPQVHPAEELRKSAQIRFQAALKDLALGVEPDLPAAVISPRRAGRRPAGSDFSPRRAEG